LDIIKLPLLFKY